MKRRVANSQVKNWIEARRLELQLSQGECAEFMGVTRQCWSAWERGIALPPRKRAMVLAELFKMSPAEVALRVAESKRARTLHRYREMSKEMEEEIRRMRPDLVDGE